MTSQHPLTGHKASAEWGRFRYSIIAPLIDLPTRQLKETIARLSQERVLTPAGVYTSFSATSLYRWYYKARKSPNPVLALSGNIKAPVRSPEQQLNGRSFTEAMISEIKALREKYPTWTHLLLYKNLEELFPDDLPSYNSLRRLCNAQGLGPAKQNPSGKIRLSYEVSKANEVWHLDFHHGKETLFIVNQQGEHHKVYLISIVDDYSRYCMHAQWYFSEDTESLVHAISQAFLKHGLPRTVYQDNGSAMISHEYKNGLKSLGVQCLHTKCYSPYQNGKIEAHWSRFEQQLLPMLDTNGLSLSQLNQVTTAFLSEEYQNTLHRGFNGIPRERYLAGPRLNIPLPEEEGILTKVFTRIKEVPIKKSDASIVIDTIRYQVPPKLLHFRKLHIAYARWQKSFVFVVNTLTNEREMRLFPVHKLRNADFNRSDLKCPEGRDIDMSRAAPYLQKILKNHKSHSEQSIGFIDSPPSK